MARRRSDTFNLAFLDIMACGLGAIVLFFMIINARVSLRIDRENQDLLSETSMLEEEVLQGKKNLVRLRNSMQSNEDRQAATRGEIERTRELIRSLLDQTTELDDDSLARKESVEQLKADLKRAEEANARLAESSDTSETTGQRVREFVGDGNRQYLTGMKMGGRRILILVDTSTSMLGRTYINVLRFRNLSDERKKAAPKWRQVLDTVDWLSAQLPQESKFQIYTFNNDAGSVISDQNGQWVEVADGTAVTAAVRNLREVIPSNGSSLINAFEAVNELRPGPDNIFLITDGLPTLGRTPPSTPEKVSVAKRMSYYSKARGLLKDKTPVNVLLFPMEGDPGAAGVFWQLARSTRGSFMAPSVDWP